MKRFAVLFLIVAAVAGMAALSVYPGRLSLWGWFGPVMFHVLFPGVIAVGVLVLLLNLKSAQSILGSNLIAFSLTAYLVLVLEIAQMPIPNRVATNGDLLLGLVGIGLGLSVTTFVFKRLSRPPVNDRRWE